MNNITIGMGIGDKKHVACVLDKTGKIITNCTIKKTKQPPTASRWLFSLDLFHLKVFACYTFLIFFFLM